MIELIKDLTFSWFVKKYKQDLISKYELVTKDLFELKKIDNNYRLTKYCILVIFVVGIICECACFVFLCVFNLLPVPIFSLKIALN